MASVIRGIQRQIKEPWSVQPNAVTHHASGEAGGLHHSSGPESKPSLGGRRQRLDPPKPQRAVADLECTAVRGPDQPEVAARVTQRRHASCRGSSPRLGSGYSSRWLSRPRSRRRDPSTPSSPRRARPPGLVVQDREVELQSRLRRVEEHAVPVVPVVADQLDVRGQLWHELPARTPELAVPLSQPPSPLRRARPVQGVEVHRAPPGHPTEFDTVAQGRHILSVIRRSTSRARDSCPAAAAAPPPSTRGPRTPAAQSPWCRTYVGSRLQS